MSMLCCCDVVVWKKSLNLIFGFQMNSYFKMLFSMVTSQVWFRTSGTHTHTESLSHLLLKTALHLIFCFPNIPTQLISFALRTFSLVYLYILFIRPIFCWLLPFLSVCTSDKVWDVSSSPQLSILATQFFRL